MANIQTPWTGPVTQDELHAYADDQLSDDRITVVEAYLRDHPADAQRVADWRAINAALRHHVDSAATEPLPAAVVGMFERRGDGRWRAIAASIVWLGIGIGVGSFGQHLALRPDLAMRVAQETHGAYAVFSPEVLHPVELGADQADHLSDWLGKRLGRPIPIPSLTDIGFSFVGGRLMVADGAPAAMMMYENASGRRLLLYVAGSSDPDDDSPMTFRTFDDSGVVTWIRDGTAYGLGGGFSETELMPAARSIRAQFSA
jgi:anti-sigma factor RsiW